MPAPATARTLGAVNVYPARLAVVVALPVKVRDVQLGTHSNEVDHCLLKWRTWYLSLKLCPAGRSTSECDPIPLLGFSGSYLFHSPNRTAPSPVGVGSVWQTVVVRASRVETKIPDQGLRLGTFRWIALARFRSNLSRSASTQSLFWKK